MARQIRKSTRGQTPAKPVTPRRVKKAKKPSKKPKTAPKKAAPKKATKSKKTKNVSSRDLLQQPAQRPVVRAELLETESPSIPTVAPIVVVQKATSNHKGRQIKQC